MPNSILRGTGLFALLLALAFATVAALDVAPARADEGDDEAEDKGEIHRLYVPFKDLQKIFEKEGEGVFLPYKEFRRLWDLAHRLPQDTRQPPVAAAVRSASYRGVADGEMIRFEAEVEVEVLAKGWQRVPLDYVGIGVEEATIDGKPALLVPTKSGYDLLLKDPGRRVLRLVLRAGSPASGDTHAAEFSVPPVPLARLTLTVPGTDTDVTIAPRLASSTRTTEAGDTELLAFLGPVAKLKLTWRRRPDDGPTIAPLVFADERLTVRVDRGVIRSTLNGLLSILRAPLERFVVAVPADAVVLSVKGEGIRTWSRNEAGDRITVELRAPAKEKYAVEVELERPLPPPPAEVVVPLAALEGMERESGYLRVQGAEGMKVEPRAAPGLIQIDLQELPKELHANARGRVLAYRFPARPGTLTLQVDALEPRITARVGNRAGVRSDGVEVRAVAALTVERAGIFAVAFDVPAGLEITNLVVQGIELDDYTQQPKDGGGSTLRVTFRDRLLGSATVLIDGRMPISVPEEKGASLEQALPLIVLEGAAHARGYVAVHVEPALDRRVVSQDGLTNLDAAMTAAIEPPALPATGEPPLPLVYRFEHREGPIALTVELERKEPMITAEVNTQVRLEPGSTKRGVTLRYRVSFRGVDTFRFTAPLALGRTVHLPDPGMDLQEPVPQGEPGEEAPKRGIWTVKLRGGERTGDVVIPLVIDDQDEGDLASGASRTTTIPTFVPIQADETPLPNTVYYVAVKRDAQLQVEPGDGLANAEEIDARELPATMQDPENFLAFRAYDPAYVLDVVATKHDQERVAELVVQHLHLDSVVPENGRATTEAYLVVRNNDRQYLELELPPEAKLRAVKVAGKTETPRRGAEGTVLIPLLSGLGKDEAFVVALVFDHDVERSGTLFECVALASLVPLGVESDILTWTVYVPSELQYTAFGGDVAQVDPEQSWAQDLLAQISSTFHHEPDGQPLDFERVRREFQSPFGTSKEGRPFHFHGRIGTGTVEITGVDRSAFAFVKFLCLVLGLVGGLALARTGHRVGLTPSLAFAALVLLLLAVMIPVGIGWAQALTAALYGVVLAGIVTFLGWARGELKRRAAEKAAARAAAPDEPEGGGGPGAPATEGGAA